MMQTHSIPNSRTISKVTVYLPASRQSRVPVACPKTFPGHHPETSRFPCPRPPNPSPHPRDTLSQCTSHLFKAIRLKWDVNMLTHAFALSHRILLRKFARTSSVRIIFYYRTSLFRDQKQILDFWSLSSRAFSTYGTAGRSRAPLFLAAPFQTQPFPVKAHAWPCISP